MRIYPIYVMDMLVLIIVCNICHLDPLLMRIYSTYVFLMLVHIGTLKMSFRLSRTPRVVDNPFKNILR
jgi:hypothetical protein